MVKISCLVLLCVAGLACRPGETARESPQAVSVPLPQPAPHPSGLSWPDSVLQAMTLEEKVGQMVMVIVPGAFTSDLSAESDRVVSLVRDWHVGGIVIARGDVYAAAVMANRLQRIAACPLLVSADLEHGLAMRFNRGTNFPGAMALGATRDPGLAIEAGRITAEEARALGIMQNFAPVADVNTNPLNPVINTRSFGDEPGLVSAMVAAFIRGTHEAGCLATAKHFPGHGSTGEDSHLMLPVLDFSRPRLDSVEFAPFRSAVDSGVDAVMVGHIAVPAVDPSGLPASLSRPLVTGLLRDSLRFNGLVITDAMGMAGARGMPPGRAAVAAVRAGIDILLLTEDEQGTMQALRDAVRGGEIPVQRIDQSVRRILESKLRLGLPLRRLVDIDSISARVGTPEHWETARRIAERALTLLRNDGSLLPLKRNVRRHLVSLILTDADDSRSEVNRQGTSVSSEPAGALLTRLLHRYRARPATIRLSSESCAGEFDRAMQRVKSADLVLVSLFFRVRTGSGKIGMPDEFAEFQHRMNALKTPAILVSFGDPYSVADWTSPRAVLCAYTDAEVMMDAVVAALFGERPVTGRIPVTISPVFRTGSGISLGTVPPPGSDTLKQAETPPPMGSVDRLVRQAIHDSVFPGAQLVIIRDNTIILQKCYGRLTYDPGSPLVDDSTLYDLASLTKVVATTPAVMKLCDEGLLGLDDTASALLPGLGPGARGGTTIRQLLLHRGGFPPFRKLWELAATPTAAFDSAIATPLVASPGDTTIYSDLGMIALGRIVQRLARTTLDEFVREEFYKPLGMHLTFFNPPSALRSRAAPTELDTSWRKTLVCGSVHDENAFLMGGVSGHAGLFSTAADLARYVAMLMNGGVYRGVEYLSAGTVREFLEDRTPGQERWLGWDMKSEEGSSAGSLFSTSSYGHTGFTGTSIWVDPDRRLAVILLTNRLYPTRANTRIIRFRPLLHDAIVRALS